MPLVHMNDMLNHADRLTLDFEEIEPSRGSFPASPAKRMAQG